jgi:hypothetical protein
MQRQPTQSRKEESHKATPIKDRREEVQRRQVQKKAITETTYKTIAPKKLCNKFDNKIEDTTLVAIKLSPSTEHSTPMKVPRGMEHINL